MNISSNQQFVETQGPIKMSVATVKDEPVLQNEPQNCTVDGKFSGESSDGCETKLRCLLCDYTCDRTSLLNCHLRTHAEEKPYSYMNGNYHCTQEENLGTNTGRKHYNCIGNKRRHLMPQTVTSLGKPRSKKSRTKARSTLPSSPSSPESDLSQGELAALVTQIQADNERADILDSEDTLSGVTGQKIKKPKLMTDLNSDEEDMMVGWLEANPIMYNKKLQAYRHTNKKERLWMEKAEEMGRTVLVLKTWYTSLRTRYGRLKKNTSDEFADSELSERDQWIKRKFEFLRPHIHRKRSVGLKLKQPTVTEVDVSDDEDLSLIVRPVPVAAPSCEFNTPLSKAKMIDADEDLRAEIQNHSQQIKVLQKQVLEKPKPGADREREAFMDWTRSVILDLDHSLWRRCQQDISQILYKYLSENDKL